MKLESNISIPAGYEQLRDARVWPRVGLTIYPLGGIQEGQIGYRIDPNGRSLIGPGAWETDWMVIGHEDLCGDPIFIDVGRPDLPVFTAAHGQDLWEAILVAWCAATFFDSLAIVDSVRAGMLDAASGLARIAEQNSDSEIDLDFWSVLME